MAYFTEQAREIGIQTLPIPRLRFIQFFCLLIFYIFSSVSYAAATFTVVDTKIEGIGGVSGLNGASAVAISPDGAHVYVTAFVDGTLTAFTRNPKNGVLTLLQAIRNSDINNEGLRDVSSVKVSPDGRHVYVTSPSDHTVAAFTRNVETGILTLVEIQKDGIKGVEGLAGAQDVAISTDGLQVYVVARQDNALTVFTRDVNTGVLSQPQVFQQGVGGIDGLQGATGVIVAQPNPVDPASHIYVSSNIGNSVSLFTRSASMPLSYVTTYKNTPDNSNLMGAYGLALSSDTTTLYVAGSTANAVSVYNRNPFDGTLIFIKGYKDGTEGIDGLSGVRSIAISQSGDMLYAAGVTDDALAVFSRDSGGFLTFDTVVRNNNGNITTLDGVVAVATVGDTVYTASLSSNAVTAFNTKSSDLALTATASALAVINSPLVYTTTIKNQGDTAVTNVMLVAVLAGGVTVVEPPQNCIIITNSVSCNLGDLAVGAETSQPLTVTTPATPTTLNTVLSVKSDQVDSNPTNNSKTVLTEVVASIATADVGVGITTSVESVAVNSPLVYHLTVTNAGPDAASAITLVVTPPDNVTLGTLDPRCTSETNTPTPTEETTTGPTKFKVTCQLGTLAKEGTGTVDLPLTTPATPAIPFTLSATVSNKEQDPVAENNTATKEVALTERMVDIGLIDVLATPSTVTVGEQISYTLKVTNKGALTANNVVMKATLPPQVQFSSTSAGCVESNLVVTCTASALASQASLPVTINVVAIQAGQPFGEPFIPVSAQFAVTSKETDTQPLDNNSTVHVTITGKSADIAVSLAEQGEAVLVNTPITFTATVANNGISTTDVTVTGVLTASNVNLTQLSVTVNEGTCTQGASFNCTFPAMATGQSKTITIQATPTALGVVTLTIEAKGDGYDPTLPNRATQQIAVTSAQTDVALTLQATPNPLLLGNSLIYTLEARNLGTVAAQNVVVEQTLPSGIVFNSVQTSQGECTHISGKINCQLGTVSATTAALVSVTVMPSALGTLSSQAQVRSATFDGVVTNNAANLEVIVTQSSANMGITATVEPPAVQVEGEVTYTLTLTNQGTDVANAVMLEATLNPAFTLTAHNSATLTCGVQANLLRCNLNSLATGGTAQVTLTGVMHQVGSITQAFTVRSQEFDPQQTDNKVEVVTQVSYPDLLFFARAYREGVDGIHGLQGIAALSLSPDGQYLYAVSSQAIATFAVGVDGQLTLIEVISDDEAQGLTGSSDVWATEHFVYVAATGENALSVFQRNSVSGRLQLVNVQRTVSKAQIVTSVGQQIYAAGDTAITGWQQDSSGMLSLSETIPTIPSAVVSYELGVMSDELSGVVAATAQHLLLFTPDSTTGKLTLQPPFPLEGTQKRLAVAGNMVYVATAEGMLTAFQLQNQQFVPLATLSLGLLQGASAMTTSGSLVFITMASSNTIAVVKHENAVLTLVDTLQNGVESVTGLGGARDVASKNGYVYVAGNADHSIAVLRLARSDLNINSRTNVETVEVGIPLTYTLTVTNQGTDTARGVVVTNTLPPQVEVLEALPNGQCTVELPQVICFLGILEKDATATVALTVIPRQMGTLTNKATVKAEQFDPTLPNETITTVQVTATTDLEIHLNVLPEMGLETETPLEITAVNRGGQAVNAATVTITLPAGLEATQLPSNCTLQGSTIPCTLSGLNPGVSVALNFILLARQVQTFTLSATLNSGAVDTNLSNNTATVEIKVLPNVISDTVDNAGQTLRNYFVTATGAIIGGNVGGTISSQGLLQSVHILPDSKVTGGKLSGTIVNEGIIENVQLLSDTTINGGTVQGQITGFPDAPATLNAKILAGTVLSHVIIGTSSEVSPAIVLGPGARFAGTVPAGMDITPSLPTLTDPITKTQVVDLQTDVTIEGSLLAAINSIPELRNQRLAFIQETTGQLILHQSTEDLVLLPWRVKQATADQAVGMFSYPDGSVVFVTPTLRIVETQPALQQPPALRQALQSFGLTEFTQEMGGVRIAGDSQRYFMARPAANTQLATSTANGLMGSPSTVVANIDFYNIQFTDSSGRREQFLYPAPAYRVELETALQQIPGASAITFYNNGIVILQVRHQTYTALLDYVVTKGVASGVTQFVSLPDMNGDGHPDIDVIYANGDRQIAFLVPEPPLATEIQAIPEVQVAEILVTEPASGQIGLRQQQKRMLLQIVATNQVALAPDMTRYADGSIEFITASGKQLLTQPLVQSEALFNATLQQFGWYLAPRGSLTGWNGNLTIIADTALQFSVRPDLESIPATLLMPLGLNSVPSSLPGVPTVLLVFRDETGVKRQQFLYPAPQEPKQLYAFLSSIPGVQSVGFFNDGTLSVISGGITYRGLFSYHIELGNELKTGGIQFWGIPDVNGDEMDDFMVVYGNGGKQIIYQFNN